MIDEQAWREYLAALREIATARENAKRRHDRASAERATKEAATNAAMRAADRQREQLERRIGELETFVETTLAEAGVTLEGPRATIPVTPLGSVEEVARRIDLLRTRFEDAATRVRAARRAAQAARARRRIWSLTAGLLVLAGVLVLVGYWWIGLIVLVVLLGVLLGARNWKG